MALLFETDRAPFVVRYPSDGQGSHEVPWRDGTGVRTARRSDLLSILVPIKQRAAFEVLEAELVCEHGPQQDLHWTGVGPAAAGKSG